ncbi:Aspartic proteinase nepenthesin-2 [Apostasia shenzhenica]|uniref:Aspartic proteinase nepenthesin-2 n=1 Tax=Apostasia shenzhenica TaxID=1088818 RepID=A0A2I0ACR8_9ASPA|nr:Aspartic proteinase nepenthesin-2 [Apostasia shenzhenica]
MKLKGLVVGCTSSAVGTSFASSDGVLALGYANNTFVSRVAARFGPRFSYCLVDHLSPRNATGYLTFGPNPDFLPPPPAAAAAPLDLNPRLQPFYYAGIEGLSVAGEVLSIPPSVWNESRRGGAILDSGTTLTVLAEPAYRAVTGALSRKLAGVPAVGLDPFEFCYNWTSPEAARAAVPELTVHFRGSARLSPPAKSYLIDVAEGVKCLGFSSTPWPGVSIIGNIMQQEHIWEFDLENQRLRFQPSNCTAIPFI